MRTPPLAALVFTTVLATALLANCSGGQDSAKAERSGTHWVNAVCTDLGRWLDTVTTPTGGSSAGASAQRLRDAVEALQPPSTDDGNAAQGEVERLVEGIRAQAGHGSTGSLVERVRRSVDGIRNLTPGGVLERAFARAPACAAVRH